MTRYYIDAKKGPAPRPERPAALACVYAYPDDHEGPLQPKYTEVRIVPADAIVIERDELPEVEDDGETLRAGRGGHVVTYRGRDVPVPRAYALGWLALAEYVKANPPVDEAAVEALADDIRTAERDKSILTHDLARALVLAGWTKGGVA